MKVKEMIELLKGFDPETECVYECCSDYAEFEGEYGMPKLGEVVIYDGRPICYHSYQWEVGSANEKKGLKPNIQTRLIFPGN